MKRSSTTRAAARCCSRSATSCSRASSPPKTRRRRTRPSPPTPSGPSSGNSWRTNTDLGVPGDVRFGSVLRNLDADAAQPAGGGTGPLERPRLPRPRPGHERRPVPHPVQHVGDARRAADGQRGPDHALSRQCRRRSPIAKRSRSTRTPPACRRGCSPRAAKRRSGSSRSAMARARSRCSTAARARCGSRPPPRRRDAGGEAVMRCATSGAARSRASPRPRRSRRTCRAIRRSCCVYLQGDEGFPTLERALHSAETPLSGARHGVAA